MCFPKSPDQWLYSLDGPQGSLMEWSIYRNDVTKDKLIVLRIVCWQVACLNRKMKHEEGRNEKKGVHKKFIYINLPFKGDPTTDVKCRRLSGPTGKPFCGVNL